MKVYQVIKKYFYEIETKTGRTDVQAADCGVEFPTFSSKKKAEKEFCRILENLGIEENEIETFPYKNASYKLNNGRVVIILQEVEVY